MKNQIPKYSAFVIKKPLIILTAVFVLILIASQGILNFKLDASSDALVMEGDESLKAFRENEKEFGDSSFLIVTYEPEFELFSINSLEKLAEIENISISTYNIIYEVLDFVKKRMSGLLTPDVEETITGSAQVLEIFKVSGAGKVAGSKVTDGEITSSSNVRLIRDGSIIFTGKIASIFREKNQVKQVNNGQECGITLKDYMDFQKNDTIEAFNVTSKERTI